MARALYRGNIVHRTYNALDGRLYSICLTSDQSQDILLHAMSLFSNLAQQQCTVVSTLCQKVLTAAVLFMQHEDESLLNPTVRDKFCIR